MSELRCVYIEDVRNREVMLLDDSICYLDKLTQLSFEGTNLCNLPDEIGYLVSLKILLLDGCCQLDELPESFTRLTNLVELSARACSFTSLPANFGNLHALQVLELENSIDEIVIPPSFLYLTCLQQLSTHYDLVTPPGYDVFITTLQENGCKFTQNA